MKTQSLILASCVALLAPAAQACEFHGSGFGAFGVDFQTHRRGFTPPSDQQESKASASETGQASTRRAPPSFAKRTQQATRDAYKQAGADKARKAATADPSAGFNDDLDRAEARGRFWEPK